MNALIRLARPDEHAAVRDLVLAAYAKWVPIIGREPMPMTADYEALVSEGHVHVMLEGTALCGVLVLLVEPDHVLIENICVHPAWQHKGIGDRLLAFTETFATQHQRHEIRLYTNQLMAANIDYYLKHGYRETHRHDVRVFMAKTLTIGREKETQ